MDKEERVVKVTEAHIRYSSVTNVKYIRLTLVSIDEILYYSIFRTPSSEWKYKSDLDALFDDYEVNLYLLDAKDTPLETVAHLALGKVCYAHIRERAYEGVIKRIVMKITP